MQYPSGGINEGNTSIGDACFIVRAVLRELCDTCSYYLGRRYCVEIRAVYSIGRRGRRIPRV